MHACSFAWDPVRGVAQPGSALGLGPRGRRFESSRPDHQRRLPPLTHLTVRLVPLLNQFSESSNLFFSQKSAKNRHFIETLLLECDIEMREKLFN
jgi:hypothetical protein